MPAEPDLVIITPSLPSSTGERACRLFLPQSLSAQWPALTGTCHPRYTFPQFWTIRHLARQLPCRPIPRDSTLSSLSLYFASSHLFAPNGFLPSLSSKGSLLESYRSCSALIGNAQNLPRSLLSQHVRVFSRTRGALKSGIFPRS